MTSGGEAGGARRRSPVDTQWQPKQALVNVAPTSTVPFVCIAPLVMVSPTPFPGLDASGWQNWHWLRAPAGS